jgi:hypothetical protein
VAAILVAVPAPAVVRLQAFVWVNDQRRLCREGQCRDARVHSTDATTSAHPLPQPAVLAAIIHIVNFSAAIAASTSDAAATRATARSVGRQRLPSVEPHPL